MKAVFDEETHYYKYVYNEWTQPTLTSNGNFGGDSMATSISYGSHVYDGGYNAYLAFSPNTSIMWVYADEWQTWGAIDFYLPKPTRITNIQITCPNTGASEGGALYNVTVYAGNSKGSTSVTLKSIGTIGVGSTYTGESTDTGYYQYFRIYFTNGGWAYQDRTNISNIKFAGVTREVGEGTASDYDYKIEGGKTYIVKENDIYKAIKSYTKGQYYGN